MTPSLNIPRRLRRITSQWPNDYFLFPKLKEHLSGTMFSSESDAKTVAENWLNGASRVKQTTLLPGCRSGLIVRSQPQGRRVAAPKPDSIQELPYKRACPSGPNALPLVWRGHFERWFPTQVLSSSSDHGSDLQGPFQNSPNIPSERDINIIKQTSDAFTNT
ncbi:hypothetical protein AVEN_12669-1 [Araneus ventricosus]|uniref:Uncharacterized protein n=1 Tax=Araneus ventricosus TaxID=182803 RepID=A0A4Y2ACL5_ARAVE|nr:hypothetical protein AVEN_12669-1 [Araneus ventricosus]